MPQASTLSLADLKLRLSNLDERELEMFETRYHQQSLKTRSRWLGILNIFLGGLTLWLGVTGYMQYGSLLHVIQAVLGLALLGQSLWAILRPSNEVSLAFVIWFLIAGAWNIFVATAAILSPIGILGLLQFWWAFRGLREYGRFNNLDLIPVSGKVAALYDEILNSLKKGNMGDDPFYLRFWLGTDLWHALLLEDYAVLGHKRYEIITVQKKSETIFKPFSAKPARKRRVYGQIQFDGKFIRSMMKGTYFKRYSEWQGEDFIEDTPSSLATFANRGAMFLTFAVVIVAVLFIAYLLFLIAVY